MTACRCSHTCRSVRACSAFTTHRWADRFRRTRRWGIADSYGIAGRRRSEKQIGKKGKSNYRCVGGKLCFVLNQKGQVVSWDAATANVHDATFHPLLERLIDESVVLTDSGFHSW